MSIDTRDPALIKIDGRVTELARAADLLTVAVQGLIKVVNQQQKKIDALSTQIGVLSDDHEEQCRWIEEIDPAGAQLRHDRHRKEER